jgi:hypothetical protein
MTRIVSLQRLPPIGLAFVAAAFGAQSFRGGNLSENSLKGAVDDAKEATDTLESDLEDLGEPESDSGQQAREEIHQLSGHLSEVRIRSRTRPTTSRASTASSPRRRASPRRSGRWRTRSPRP